MVKVPLTNSPNQSFLCNVPIGNTNKLLKFKMWFNYEANYWLMSIYDVRKEVEIISNFPLIFSKGAYMNLFHQISYKNLGPCAILPLDGRAGDAPDEKNIGDSYIFVWGDELDAFK